MSPQDSNADHFDLLPFIAILMCVLGCLLLVTVSMSAISMGVGAGEVWIPAQPGGEKNNKSPVLVEFGGNFAVFHTESGRHRVDWQPSGQRTVTIGGSTYVLSDDKGKDDDATSEISPLLKALEDRKDTHYALIAVRPSGFPKLQQFLNEFRRRDITVGFEPIDQMRPVSLADDVALPPTSVPKTSGKSSH